MLPSHKKTVASVSWQPAQQWVPGIYQTLLKDFDTTVIESPLLAQLVQDNQIDLLETALSHYLAPLLEKNIDTLLLGCTHYPHVEQFLKGHSLNIIDSSRCFIPDLVPLLKGHIDTIVTGTPLIADCYSCSELGS